MIIRAKIFSFGDSQDCPDESPKEKECGSKTMAGSGSEKRVVMREQSNPISVQSSESMKSTNTIKGDAIRTTVIQVKIFPCYHQECDHVVSNEESEMQ